MQEVGGSIPPSSTTGLRDQITKRRSALRSDIRSSIATTVTQSDLAHPALQGDSYSDKRFGATGGRLTMRSHAG